MPGAKTNWQLITYLEIELEREYSFADFLKKAHEELAPQGETITDTVVIQRCITIDVLGACQMQKIAWLEAKLKEIGGEDAIRK